MAKMIRVRCVAPLPYTEDDAPEVGCGWEGNSMQVTEYGLLALELEECPSCGGPVEVCR